jgi:hypothetical protein
MSQSLIERLGLSRSAAISATLADGGVTELSTFHCEIDCLEIELDVEVIQNVGQYPLLGIGLLRGRRLIVDYGARLLTID